MMTLYLVALLAGGTLLALTLVLGAIADADHDGDVDFDHDVGADVDFDADVDVDVDADVHVDAHVDHDLGGIDAVLGWLPITSIRFWTYFSAFFGGTGAALTGLGLLGSQAIIAPISVGMGWTAGFSVVRIIRSLRKNETSSSLGPRDYMGATGVVTIKIAKGETGQIRLKLKDRFVEVMAETEDEEPLASKAKVLIYNVTDDGTVMVTKADQLEAQD
jgi:hypothetical protein